MMKAPNELRRGPRKHCTWNHLQSISAIRGLSPFSDRLLGQGALLQSVAGGLAVMSLAATILFFGRLPWSTGALCSPIRSEVSQW